MDAVPVGCEPLNPKVVVVPPSYALIAEWEGELGWGGGSCAAPWPPTAGCLQQRCSFTIVCERWTRSCTCLRGFEHSRCWGHRPTHTLHAVRGTQNYSCSGNGTWALDGVKATAVDADTGEQAGECTSPAAYNHVLLRQRGG